MTYIKIKKNKMRHKGKKINKHDLDNYYLGLYSAIDFDIVVSFEMVVAMEPNIQTYSAIKNLYVNIHSDQITINTENDSITCKC